MLYWSKRNYYYKAKNGKTILWIGNSKSLLEVNDDFIHEVNRLVETGVSDINSALVEKLCDIGALLPYPEEKYDLLLKDQIRRYKYNPAILGVTIMTTSTCNLNCSYCFEKNVN